MIYIGLLADEKVYHFGANSVTGGPLGELVQWSDLIASSYLLGHDITVSVDNNEVKRFVIFRLFVHAACCFINGITTLTSKIETA